MRGLCLLLLATSLLACGSDDGRTVRAAADDEPSCESIEAFARAIVDVGITYDYEPSMSPASLAARSDVVFSGRLTGELASRVAERDEPVTSWMAFEVEVDRVLHGALAPGDRTFVGVEIDPAHEPPEHYEELLPEGAPVVVFTTELADPPAEVFVGVEGFATACPGGRPLGRLGDTPEWREPATLPELVDAADEPVDRVEVTLWHCGIDTITVDDRRWEVPAGERPFDGTNAPDSFAGKGSIEGVGPDELRYVDDSGVVLRFVPDDGEEPPCA